MRRFLLGLSVAALLVPALASAQNQPAVMFHVDDPLTGKGVDVCADYVAPADCDGVVVQKPAGVGVVYHVYLLTATGGMNSYAGLELSVHYEEDPDILTVFGWNLCASQEFKSGGWGEQNGSGGDNLLSFDPLNDCQDGDTIVVNGWFYVGAYGDAQMGIAPRSASGELKVAECSGNEFALDPMRSGSAGFGTLSGCNSCLADCIVPVEETTWGDVKTLFKSE